MKNKIPTFIFFVFNSIIYSQVGVNNQNPKATLDVTAKSIDGSTAEGIIAPRLTGDQLKSGDGLYSTDQKGSIVYVTEAVNSPSNKTLNVNVEGYYYFSGSQWQKIGNTASAENWALNGNSGTSPSTNFIGTKGSGEHLLFKVANIGAGLIMDNSTGFRNTAFGAGSLNPAANNYNSIYYNTAIGSNALARNTGNNNTAVGADAASSGTTGNYNTAIGRSSLSNNRSGSFNSALGYLSLSGNTTGDKNIGIGKSAGNNITTGNNNIIIGTDQQAALNTESNQLNIGGIIFGTGLTGNSALPAGNIGIGIVSPTQKLDVDGTLRLRSIPATGGTVMLTADNNGVIRQQALPSSTRPVLLSSSATGVNLDSSTWAQPIFTGTSITIPANSKYIVNTIQLIGNNNPMPDGQSVWMQTSFSDSSSVFQYSNDIIGAKLISGSWSSSDLFGTVSGSVILNNTSATDKTYYYWVKNVTTNAYSGTILNFGGTAQEENQMYAIPVN